MEQRAATRQRTIRGPLNCHGVGLHTGARVAMTLHPAAIDAGISFRRADKGVTIAASWRNLAPSTLCTTLASGTTTIATVEHLMAAFAGLEIDNATVELDGPEVPAMDGSAAPFVALIEAAGIVEQDAPRRAIKVLKPVRVEADGASVLLEPDDGFALSFSIDFASSAIRRQRLTIVPDPASFKRGICNARTFGFLDDVERLRAAGLVLGGSLDNAVVISGDRILNEGGLRHGDEFVRHKVLDAMGDLYLAGGPIRGRFHGRRSGHALNRRLLERLFADRKAWRYVAMAAARPLSWDELPQRASA
jgi:UDP-3-O-[3-hydroxymyristoyl] N-acetylglucosamine deacetylase